MKEAGAFFGGVAVAGCSAKYNGPKLRRFGIAAYCGEISMDAYSVGVLYYLSTANCNHLFPIHESTINWDDEGKGGIIVIQGGLKE